MSGFAELFGLRNWRHLRKWGKTRKFGMTSQREQQWLRTYAARSYRGIGAIVDLGCFLGATTIAFAEGLALNRKANRKQIHAYDLFIWNKRYEAWAEGKEVEGLFSIGGSFLPEFLRRTQNWRDYIVIHEEDPLSDISASRLLQLRGRSSAIEPVPSRERNRTAGLGGRFITSRSFIR